MVVAGLVQGLLVGRHHRQELLPAAGEPAEALVHCLGNVPEDGGWVVRECVDVEKVGVWFGVRSEEFCRQVQGKIKKIDDFSVHLTNHFQTVVLENLLSLLPQFLSEASSQRTHVQPIVPVEAEVDREVTDILTGNFYPGT